MENYLLANHRNDIVDLLNNTDDSSAASISVNLTHLQQANPTLFTDVVNDPHTESSKWSSVMLDLQNRFAVIENFLEPDWEIKENGRIRFTNLPEQDIRNRLTFPTIDDLGKFVQIKGTVIRITQPTFLEYKTDYICGHCKSKITIEGEYAKNYLVTAPNSCPNGCKGRPYSDTTNIVNENFITYQEIKIMETVSQKSIPSVLEVTLEDDLVDSCQPSDGVTICGTVESRWVLGNKMQIKVVIRANSVSNRLKQINIGNELPEHLICLRAEWNEFTEKFGELGARDILIQSICPDVHGMYMAKLAVALAICSGYESSISGLRNHSHVLLIGDPGLAKSRLLKFAASVSTRSSFVTGSGISSAGLTAAAFQEGGEWQLEAGALPLADNGICCIDEFNMMSDSDKASLHEAMEQQTIHISKAGIACKLNTRCTIIAATNPKNLYCMSDHEGTSAINLGIASSLVSRFDLVLILRDERNTEWDTRVANHIFYETGPVLNANLYDLAKLQAHFSAVRDFDPIVTDGAKRILKAYYLACRADEERDAGRTTIRFNDSLYRLAKAHAKLLFRHEVTESDAVMVVMLMESSFGFGRILQPKNVVREDLPLGPNDVQINELLERLNLEATSNPNADTIASGNENRRSDTEITDSEVSRRSEDSGIFSSNSQSGARSTSDGNNESSRTENVNARRTDEHSEIQKIGQPFDAKAYALQKRRLNGTCTAVSDENTATTSTTVPTGLFYNLSGSRIQQQNKEVLQSLQNIEMNPATSQNWRKRMRMDLNDDELDRIFALDEPDETVLKPTETNVINFPVAEHSTLTSTSPNSEEKERDDLEKRLRMRLINHCADEASTSQNWRKRIRMDINDDELDRIFTLDEPDETVPKPTEGNVINIPVAEHSTLTSSSPNSEEKEGDDQENQLRMRIFNRCTDEDLAAFDDFDF